MADKGRGAFPGVELGMTAVEGLAAGVTFTTDEGFADVCFTRGVAD